MPAEPIPGPYYIQQTAVYALAKNPRGHLENSFSAAVQSGWINGRKTPPEQLKATAQLFRAAPNLLEAAKKVLAEFDKPGSAYAAIYSGTGSTWVAELRYAIWLAYGGWICVCDKINEASYESCRGCGLDKVSMGIDE